MYSEIVVVILILAKVPTAKAAVIDLVDCGVDHEIDVTVGELETKQYPWYGILYYYNYEDMSETRAVTPVALIHEEFVIASASDIGPMPKTNFREMTRVLLGEGWEAPGRRVRNYVMHPEYEETYNTLAIVQLKDPVRNRWIKPLCPPPEIIRNPEFYVIKFKDDGTYSYSQLQRYVNSIVSVLGVSAADYYNTLTREVIAVSHVPARMCKDFYVAANLYAKKLRPPHVVCAVSLETEKICVWETGAVMVMRDVWGRWQVLGFGVRGPGCGAPSRYLDMMSYFPWVEESLNKFRRLSISKINKHKYVLRSSAGTYQRFGACDPEEKKNLVFREYITLRTDNTQYQFLTYNMTIFENIEYTCLTLELVNASAVSEMRIRHVCGRDAYGPACYYYKMSVFDISVYLMFSDKCSFEMFAWGFKKDMRLLDIMKWKWEEGTYYQDFAVYREEYKGPQWMTGFGFEPLDTKMWIPEYDIWTTTEFDNSTWSSTTPVPDKTAMEEKPKEAEYIASVGVKALPNRTRPAT